jgi:DNA adenine methylase
MICRYPGGKARFRQAILSVAPARYTEYREALVGGGAVFFGIDKKLPRWINDKDGSLVEVYLALRDRPAQFIESCREIKPLEEDEGPERLQAVFDQFVKDTDMDPALRYYFLNRVSWGGIPTHSHQSLSFSTPENWNVVMSDRLWQAAALLEGVKITHGDYLPVLQAPGEGVWVYCDPSYYVNNELPKGGRLYRHTFTEEQHIAFAQHVSECPHKVVISYDDHPFIHDLYAGRKFRIFVTEPVRYQLSRKEVRELIITNY